MNALFIIDDNRNQELAKMFLNSIRKFHTEKELVVKIIDPNDYEEFKADTYFYYKAKALIANKFLDEYETVIIADADHIMTGDITHILSLKDYDAGCVLNFNTKDAKEYGAVSVWDIAPQEYLNAGFIAFRSKEFASHLLQLCNSKHFDNYRYKEQDLLNIMAHYGNYKVRVFDLYDPEHNYSAFHGLVSKAWWNMIIMQEDKLVITPKNVPAVRNNVEVKLIHWAGGNTNKMNYKIYFTDEVSKRLDYLVSEVKND